MSQIDIDWVFTRIPLLRGLAPGDFDLSPLPGYTNLNYRLHNREYDWVLRLPRHETNPFIDRAAEAHNQALAAELGLAPQPEWRDASGITLTTTLNRSRAVISTDLNDPSVRQQVVNQLQRLHRADIEFRGAVDLGALLQQYFSLSNETQQQALQERMDGSGETLARIAELDLAPVASHNDLVLENLLLAPDRLWLIDWEYSAMASPYWDLATLCNAAQFSSDQSEQLLDEYAQEGDPMNSETLSAYREVLQLLNDCWMSAFGHD